MQIKGQTLVYQSFLTHGVESHKIETLFDYGDYEPQINELKKLENVYIRYYKYWKGCTMLNSNDGGGGSNKWSDEKKNLKSIERKGLSFGAPKILLQYDFNGEFIREWKSIKDASNELKIDYNLLIRCCKGKFNSASAGGFQWKYKLDDNYPLNIGKYVKVVTYKSVLEYDLDGNFVKEWASYKELCNALKISRAQMYRTLKYKTPKYNTQDNIIDRQFKYKTGDIIEKIEPLNTVKILQYDIEGNLIRLWNSTREVERTLKINKKNVNNALNGSAIKAFKYQWRYSRDGNYPKKIQSLIKHNIITEDPVKVLQYGLDGKFIKSWDYVYQAALELKISESSIGKNIKGELKTAGKFQWRFGTLENIVDLKPIKIVSQYTLDGKLVKDWNSTTEIVSDLGYRGSYISNCLRKTKEEAYGYKWMYK